jgi:hypothetical protein
MEISVSVFLVFEASGLQLMLEHSIGSNASLAEHLIKPIVDSIRFGSRSEGEQKERACEHCRVLKLNVCHFLA